MELWELVARESIRDVILAYAYRGDRLLVDEMAELFSDDGVLEVTREATSYIGRAEIAARLGHGRGTSTRAARAHAHEHQQAVGIVVVRRHVVTTFGLRI